MEEKPDDSERARDLRELRAEGVISETELEVALKRLGKADG
jgi:hypothetical protein